MRTALNLILLASLLPLIGCKATPKRIAYTTIDQTTDAVKEAYSGYGDYMRARFAFVINTANPLEERRAAMDEYRDMLSKLPELKKLWEDYVAVADEAVLILGIPNNAPPTDKILAAAQAVLNITNRFLQ